MSTKRVNLDRTIRWKARVKVRGLEVYLGQFEKKEDADYIEQVYKRKRGIVKDGTSNDR